jgi:alpha-L-rhamnosidase
MKTTTVSLSIFFLNFIHISYSLSDIKPVELKCEYLLNPLAVESPRPRLSWILEENDPKKQNLSQKAYQIVVASTKALLDSNKGDLWDTNKVLSNKNAHISYNGVKLHSRQRAYWKVKVWDQNDSESEFSPDARWETGFIGPNDWTAHWIGAPNGMQANASQNILPADHEVLNFLPSSQ